MIYTIKDNTPKFVCVFDRIIPKRMLCHCMISVSHWLFVGTKVYIFVIHWGIIDIMYRYDLFARATQAPVPLISSSRKRPFVSCHITTVKRQTPTNAKCSCQYYILWFRHKIKLMRSMCLRCMCVTLGSLCDLGPRYSSTDLVYCL